MIEIQLTKNKVARVSKADFRKVGYLKWQAHQNQSKRWYAKRKFSYAKGKRATVFMHRFIMDAPEDLHVDHIDGDGLNNCRDNLQLLTPDENRNKAQVKQAHGSEEPWL